MTQFASIRYITIEFFQTINHGIVIQVLVQIRPMIQSTVTWTFRNHSKFEQSWKFSTRINIPAFLDHSFLVKQFLSDRSKTNTFPCTIISLIRTLTWAWANHPSHVPVLYQRLSLQETTSQQHAQTYYQHLLHITYYLIITYINIAAFSWAMYSYYFASSFHWFLSSVRFGCQS